MCASTKTLRGSNGLSFWETVAGEKVMLRPMSRTIKKETWGQMFAVVGLTLNDISSGDLPQLPLGDIARRYRDAKRAMQAPTPFHLPFDEPAFASLIAPVTKPAPPRPVRPAASTMSMSRSGRGPRERRREGPGTGSGP